VAFIDDQPFELEEVRFSLPEVLCLSAGELDRLLDMPEMNPRLITKDSKNRRLMYVSDMARRKAEEEFVGPKEEFLATLGMVFTISTAKEEDLRRAEELTLRTNQLNTSGYTYSYKELASFIRSNRYKLLIASLDDRFGTYSKIGLALIECAKDVWTIKLLLMSCRVMSRGVGSILLSFIMRMAREEGAQLRADFIPNGRNRMMHVTYKFAGFREVEKVGELIILENNLTRIQPFPGYVKVQTCV
jgi:FkbH-like protein